MTNNFDWIYSALIRSVYIVLRHTAFTKTHGNYGFQLLKVLTSRGIIQKMIIIWISKGKLKQVLDIQKHVFKNYIQRIFNWSVTYQSRKLHNLEVVNWYVKKLGQVLVQELAMPNFIPLFGKILSADKASCGYNFVRWRRIGHLIY